MKALFDIDGHQIGPGHPTFIIAEMSANHNQDFEQAVKIVEMAKKSGADAIKLQTYTPDTITIDCNNRYFQINDTLWKGKTLYELYKEAFTPWEWQPKLKAIADRLDLTFFSTPFDETAVEFLLNMDVAAFKIASFENIDLPFIKRITQTGKPILLSTGMATLSEIDEAVRTVESAGGEKLALLKCTSAYPARPEEMNLITIPHLSETYRIPVGLSDHSLETAVPVAACTLGANIIEKHFTISRELLGPDSGFSLEPHEFKKMVNEIRQTEKALGRVFYGVGPNENASRVFRRSLFAVEDIRAGEMFSKRNIRSIRPGYGLHPRHFYYVLGKVCEQDLQKGTPLQWDFIGKRCR
jgi:pseudaminic acid synthase